MLEARAHQRAEHRESKQTDRSPSLLIHPLILRDRMRHKRWDRIRGVAPSHCLATLSAFT
jgi:hypothetical protein